MFETCLQQEAAVRSWLITSGLSKESARLNFIFYEGRFDCDFGSILPVGDLTALIPPCDADVCILEEPEHLNWQRPPGRLWTALFSHVIGVVHTNYLAYSAGCGWAAPLLTAFLKLLNK